MCFMERYTYTLCFHSCLLIHTLTSIFAWGVYSTSTLYSLWFVTQRKENISSVLRCLYVLVIDLHYSLLCECTFSCAEWKIAISIIIPLIVGALFLTLVMLCVWRWRKRNGAAIRHNDNHGGNLPPAIGIGNLQNEDVGAVNHEAAEAVREDIHGEGDDADDLPVANAAPDNQNRENNGADDLPLAMPMAIIDNGIRGDHGAEEIEVDDEEFRESPSHQSVEQCTDRNDRYYAASDIVRMASSKGLSVNHTERINRPWDQHLSSSPVRSQAYHSLVCWHVYALCMCNCICTTYRM